MGLLLGILLPTPHRHDGGQNVRRRKGIVGAVGSHCTPQSQSLGRRRDSKGAAESLNRRVRSLGDREKLTSLAWRERHRPPMAAFMTAGRRSKRKKGVSYTKTGNSARPSQNKQCRQSLVLLSEGSSAVAEQRQALCSGDEGEVKDKCVM